MAKLIILRIQVYSFGTNWLQHLAVVSGVLGLSHIKRLQFVGQLIIESHSQLVEYRCFGLPARLTDPKHRYLTSWERDSIISSLTNWNFNGGADLPMCKTRRLWLVWRKKKNANIGQKEKWYLWLCKKCAVSTFILATGLKWDCRCYGYR